MKTNSLLIVILYSIHLTACIERYYLEEHVKIKPRLVIDGNITDACSKQEIVVSISSSTENAIFLPLSACVIFVEDIDGNTFEFYEDQSKLGHYYGKIEEKYLITSNKFRLMLETPDGKFYTSSFEEMLACPPIDSVYFEIEHNPTTVPGEYIDGIQFYLDFKASEYFGNYYKIVLEETYEYHSTWPKKNYLDFNSRFVYNELDYSTYVCYKTSTIDNVLTLSTEPMLDNRYRGYKLLFVDNQTQRLKYNFSLLVKQRSLSKKAYQYWERLRLNNKENLGLFTKQPSILVGNLSCINDTNEEVLGYFNVSSETVYHVVISDFKGLDFNKIQYCTPFPRDVTWPFEPRPLYLLEMEWMGNPSHPAWAPSECFDCTLLGGVLEKPDFFKY